MTGAIVLGEVPRTYLTHTRHGRSQEMSNKREVIVRPVHREAPDLHKLAEALIRLVLEESGRTRVIRRAEQPPTTLRLPGLRTSGSEVPGIAS